MRDALRAFRAALALGAVALAVPARAAESDFSLIVLPDTQFYSESYPQLFHAQTQWIADNRAALDIAYVAHVGDCVESGNNGGNPVEWLVADAAMDRIEDPVATALPEGIPYGIAVGNHDQSPTGSNSAGSTASYNQFFGASRFQGRAYYGGHYGSDNDHHVDYFSASGMDFMVVYFEYDTSPDSGPLDWADALLAANPNRRAIAVAHFIINTAADFGTQGQAIYDALKDRPNLFLLLAGHRSGEARRTDVFAGNTVHTLLADYQSRNMGGDGWLRILEFSPSTDQIRVRTYSPWLDQYETDSSSQFTLAYDMTEPSCLSDGDCDDGLFCNGSETCNLQTGCQAGTPPALSDGVGCTADSCDEVADAVVHTPQAAACDNGLFCDGSEVCDPTLDCQPGTPPALSDGVGCTADSCDEVADTVVHTPQAAACDNGLFCDGSEICDPTLDCQPGAPPVLDDSVSCTADSCDEVADTVVHTPQAAACDNGLFCDGSEVCDPTLDCQPGTPPVLDDSVGCTADTCDEVADTVVHTPQAATCDNGLFCDGSEVCDPTLDCQPGTPPVLDDSVSCTADTCDEVADTVVHTPQAAACDNGLFCDGAEVCDPALDCQPGAPPPVSDGVDCTDDFCDEGSGSVLHTPNAALCDDGDECTAEVCDGETGCGHVPIPECAVPVPALPAHWLAGVALALGAAALRWLARGESPLRP